MHNERDLTGRLLREVANDCRFITRREELGALAEAVTEGGSREAVWRGVDLQAAFSPETTIRLKQRRRRWLAGTAGALAGIVVFVPVAWTWWSLHRATEAYQVLLAKGLQQDGASFLQLWTTGFGGNLDPHFRLSSVALWAVIVIATGVALIALERVFSRSADQADDDEHRACASRLARTLNYASITINCGNIQDPIQVVDLLDETVRQLLQAHQQTRESADLLRRASYGLDESTMRTTSTLEASLSALLATFRSSIEGTVTTFDSSVQGVSAELLKAAGSITKDFGQSIASTSGILETSVATVAGELSASAGRVAKASDEMQAAVTASATAQQTLAGAASSIGTNIHALETNLRSQLQGAADAINREVAALRGTTSEFARNVSDNTKDVGHSLGQYTSALQHQISELTQIRATLERLSDEKSPADEPSLMQAAER